MNIARRQNKLILSNTHKVGIYTIDLVSGSVDIKLRCSRCKEVKPETDFQIVGSRCKKCKSEEYRQWVLKNKAKRNAISIAYQNRRLSEGNCVSCGKPRNKYKRFCDKCGEKRKVYYRDVYNRKLMKEGKK